MAMAQRAQQTLEKIQDKAEMQIGIDKPTNDAIYGASLFSILLSLLLLRKNPVLAVFTGLWAPTILGLGVFFKENRLMAMQKHGV